MKTVIQKLLAICAFWACFAPPVYAAPPDLITYQGRLKENNQPVTGNRVIEIILCNDPLIGTCTTSGEQTVYVSTGLFKSTFTAPVDLAISAWYLQVKVGGVGGQLLWPREQLSSVPYAMLAATAAYVSGAVAKTGDAMSGPLETTTMTITGNAFSVGGSTLVVKDGNVGIGTTAPLSRFDVLDGSITVRGTNAGLTLQDAGRVISPETDATLGAGIKVSTNVYIIGFSSAAKYYGDGSSLSGVTASGAVSKTGDVMSGPLQTTTMTLTGDAFSVGGSTLVVSNGNVGIGTSSPQYALHTQLGSAGWGLYTSVPAGAGGGVYVDGASVQIGANTPSVLSLNTNAVPRMTILNSGNVGVGTAAPFSKFDVLDGSITIRGANAALVFEDSSRVISSETASDLGAGIRVSTNVYIVGFSSAAKYYGDGSGLTNLTGDGLGSHVATTTLQMGAYGVNTSSDITAARYQINGSTMVAVLPGTDSIAYGLYAGNSNVTGGNYNVFIGNYAGTSNTTGAQNSFLGYGAGYINTAGTQNSFLGYQAGYNNTTGNDNSFLGYRAGYSNNTGDNNSFIGRQAGSSNMTGSSNSFLGHQAGFSNTTGNYNSFLGGYAGYYNQTGSGDAVLGYNAGGYGAAAVNSFSSSTIVGYQAGYNLTTGSDNTFLGWQSGYNVTTGTGNIVIGYDKRTSAPGASNELNIGGVLYGNLSAKTIGISTGSPQAALDIVSTGTLANQYAQIWRDSTGLVVASMTATGRLSGDGSGLTGITAAGSVSKTGDNMTGRLTAPDYTAAYGIIAATAAFTGDITAANYRINGSTVVAILPGTASLGIGVNAGRVNTGDYNVFVGSAAGYSNFTGSYNSFLGYGAGYNNTTGWYNSYLGYAAGYYNTTGGNNSFLGFQAGYNNTSGGYNSYLGFQAGYLNTTGGNNSHLGNDAGYYNTTGGYNSYLGSSAGYSNKTGSANAIFGYMAGYGVFDNSFSSSTLMGYRAGYSLSNGSADNIFLGFQAGYYVTTGTGNIIIGYNKDTSAPGASNELNIGGVIYGNLSARTIGISTRAPQAALDIVSTGTAANVYAQIWRDSTGLVVASMTATGRLSGDGSGLTGITTAGSVSKTGDTMTGRLTAPDYTATYGIIAASAAFSSGITASSVTVTGNAFSVGGSTLVVKDGNVGIGTAAPGTQVEISGTAAGFTQTRANGAFADAPDHVFRKARGTVAVPSAVASDDNLGIISFLGYDGAAYQPGSWILSKVDGPAGAGDMPGRLEFHTTPDGSGVSLERMRISNSGNVGIGTSTPQGLLHVGAGAAPGLLVDIAGNVGIGIVNPIYSLHVAKTAGNIAGYFESADNTGSGIYLAATGALGRNYGLFSTASGLLGGGKFTIYDASAAAYRLTIDATGNVGIGTTSPGVKLDVAGEIKASSISVAGVIRSSSSIYPGADGVFQTLRGMYDDSAKYSTGFSSNVYIVGFSSAAKYYGDGSGLINLPGPTNMATTDTFQVISGTKTFTGQLVLNSTLTVIAPTNAASSLWVSTSVTTPHLYVSTSGNVGIGMTTISSKLMLGSGQFSVPNGSNSFPPITNIDSLNTGIFFPTNNSVGFTTGLTERMRITNTGDVGIGTTNPQSKLDVAGIIRSTSSIAPGDGTGFQSTRYMYDDPANYRTAFSSNVYIVGYSSAAKYYGDGSGLSGVSATDPTKLPLGGGTMIGQLTVSGASVTVGGVVSAANYRINGSTVLTILPGVDSFAAGVDITTGNTGAYDTFVGYSAGRSNTLGSNNSFFGNSAGFTNTDGGANSFIGYSAGYSNSVGNSNSFLGTYTGYKNTDGGNNTFLGATAGYSNTTGWNNAFVGYGAGYNTRTGGANSIVGYQAGLGLAGQSFSSSTLMGYQAGYALTTGSDNILLGFNAGSTLKAGSGNIVIGYDKTTSGINANNELNIGDVLYGNLSVKTIGISTRSPQAALDIVSTGTATNIYAQIWRNASGTIVSSMSSTGVMTASTFNAVGSAYMMNGTVVIDSNRNVFAKTMAVENSMDVSSLTISGNEFSVGGSTLVVKNGNVGIGTLNPNYKLDMAGFEIGGVSTITMLNGSIAILPPGAGGNNQAFAISIGSNSSNNYNYGVGVGYEANSNSNGGVGLGYQANSNSSSGVGVGAGAFGNTNSGVGVGAGASGNSTNGVGVGSNASANSANGVGVGNGASGNSNSGVGVGALASGNANYAVGIGAYSQNNKTYGSALGAYSYAASSSVALGAYAKANAPTSVAIGDGTINNSTGTASFGVYAINTSSNVYIVGFSSAGKYYGDGSGLTGIPGDNLGNHIATTTLDMSNFSIVNASTSNFTGYINVLSTAGYAQAGYTILRAADTTSGTFVGRNAGRVNTGVNNSFLGYQAGSNNTTGGNNSFLGYQAGYSNTSGGSNSFLGFNAGYSNISGGFNSFLGIQAGYFNNTGSNNSFLGYFAGFSNIEGVNNSFLGSNAGLNNLGGNNSFLGFNAGLYNQTGSANAIFGSEAGLGVSLNSFSSSTLMGYQAGYGLTTGSDNIFLGFQAGFSVTSGTGNIVIGYNKDTTAATANNELNIGGVLYGNLAARTIGIGVPAPGQLAALDVRSTATASDVYTQVWRDFSGVIVASVSATGVMSASTFNAVGSAYLMNGTVVIDSARNVFAKSMAVENSMDVSSLTISGDEFSVGGSTLVVKAGKVGIGTTAPGSRFEVVGGSSTFRGSDSNSAIAGFTDAGGNYRVVISTSGNVGIGTTSPDGPLEVAGPSGPRIILNATDGSGAVLELRQAGTKKFSATVNSGDTYLDAGSGSNLHLRSNNGGTDNINITAGGNIIMNGNIGVGTTVPGANLHISSISASATQDMLKVTTGTVNADIFVIKGSGRVGISTGNPQAALDIVAYGAYAQIWRNSPGFVVASMTATGQLNVAGGIRISAAGSGLQVTEGLNARMGTITLVAGTATIPNTSVTANSRIFLTAQIPSATPGALYVSARTSGVDFTIASTAGATDTSTVAWLLVEP